MLFEALTGRKAFAGDDVSEILASVLRDEPDWNAVPSSFSKLLRRCLHKDVRQRFHHIGDVRVELEGTTAVYVHNLAQTSGRLLEGTETAQEAFFSPDGQSIGFIAADNYIAMETA